MKRQAVAGRGWRPGERLLRRGLWSVEPYQAIQPPGDLEGDTVEATGQVIKLDGNENVYGCSPRVREALRSYASYHIYPDPQQRELRRALEGYTGLEAAHILAGAGSDELIDLLLRLLLEPGDRIVNCLPTFGMYAFSAQLCGGQVIDVPRTPGYAVDIKEVLGAVDERTKAVFLASPNNPTGTLTPRADILSLLETEALVVVDEAYYEFCGVTVADEVPRHDNLVVLRTFSKWAGLAGLRIGYGLFPPALVSHLIAIKTPYNVSAAAQVAAMESLMDLDYLMGTVRAITRERDRLYGALQHIPFLEPVPSQANFVLCKVTQGDARQLQRWLRRQGIFVRHFDTPLLGSAIRISAGKPEHTDAVAQALRSWEGMG